MTAAPESATRWCQSAIERYLAIFPDEVKRLESFRALLQVGVDLRSRKTTPGHITASGMVCDPVAEEMLLIHHGTLGKWLQPGGHVEGEELPPAAARREVAEEVGIVVDRLLSISAEQPVPLDIDSHAIPPSARKAEPGHTHHDFLFAFEVSRATAVVALQLEEVSASQWVGYDDPRLEPRLRRVVEKLRTQRLWPIQLGS